MISIITPTIRPNELIKLKKAIKQQTFKDFEHIIVEDRARLGAAVMRNEGLKKAKGEFIAFIDDDCVPDHNWLEDHYNFLKKNKDVAACSGLVYPPNNAKLLTKLNYYKSMSDENTGKIEKEGTIDVDHVSCTNSMWRRKALDKLNGFDIKLRRSQDLDLGLRAKAAGMKMKAFNGAMVYHNYPSTLKETLRKSFVKGTGGAHILRKHPDYFGWRRHIIYLFPLYVLFFPLLWPYPFFLCHSGFKVYEKEDSLPLGLLAMLLEYIKYHFNLVGIWWGILRK